MENVARFPTQKTAPRVLLHAYALYPAALTKHLVYDSKKSLLRKLFLSVPIKICIGSL